MSRTIEVQGLSFRYRGSPSRALRDVHLQAEEGEVLLVTGPTGSGKSTLIRALNGLIPDFYEGEAQGSVVVAGRDVLSLRPNRVATFVGTVFQSPEAQIIASQVHRDVAFGLENLGWEKEAIATRAEEVLETVGLSGMESRDTSTLSGGQKQRLALAAIMAMRPPILLLDEPASELDPRGRREILGAVEDLIRQGAKTMIITDHRLGDLLGIVDRVIVMHQGEIAIDGPPRQVMARPELEDWGVEIPAAVQVWRGLRHLGFDVPCPLTSEELVAELVPNGRTLSEAFEAPA